MWWGGPRCWTYRFQPAHQDGCWSFIVRVLHIIIVLHYFTISQSHKGATFIKVGVHLVQEGRSHTWRRSLCAWQIAWRAERTGCTSPVHRKPPVPLLLYKGTYETGIDFVALWARINAPSGKKLKLGPSKDGIPAIVQEGHLKCSASKAHFNSSYFSEFVGLHTYDYRYNR